MPPWCDAKVRPPACAEHALVNFFLQCLGMDFSKIHGYSKTVSRSPSEQITHMREDVRIAAVVQFISPFAASMARSEPRSNYLLEAMVLGWLALPPNLVWFASDRNLVF